MRVVRVLPDVSGVNKTFDYLVPEAMDGVTVGSIVRADLHGRRVRAWVIEDAVEPDPAIKLRELTKLSSLGPPAELIAVAEWASWRWAGHRSFFLQTASPPSAVRRLPSPLRSQARRSDEPPLLQRALEHEVGTVRVPPGDDLASLVTTLATRGSGVVLAPSVARAQRVVRSLHNAGITVAMHPDDWAREAAGNVVVVGTRAAAWTPLTDAAFFAVIDAHDDAYKEERSPTWNAVDVVAERARRAGVPCVLFTPCPTVTLMAMSTISAPSRNSERTGWPVVEVVDLRRQDPRVGLLTEPLTRLIRSHERILIVLNRKGRAQLLSCAQCGELTRCERCGASMAEAGEGLRCRRCESATPRMCQSCGSTRLKQLRVGVSRIREEVEALAGEPVGELTKDSDAVPGTRVIVGTEAVLQRVRVAGVHPVVAFLDFDQELLVPRYRAAEEALALLCRAGRLTRGRGAGGRILIQTRLPEHEVVEAAVLGDPDRVSVVEQARRVTLQMPPERALAVVSGEGAPDFVSRIKGVEVLGPSEEKWMIKAVSHQELCNALAATERPASRLRIDVDPTRI